MLCELGSCSSGRVVANSGQHAVGQVMLHLCSSLAICSTCHQAKLCQAVIFELQFHSNIENPPPKKNK
eukprot:4431038-Amphidinium_carterae.1